MLKALLNFRRCASKPGRSSAEEVLSRSRQILLLIVIAGMVVFLDQWTKSLVLDELSPVYRRPVIEGYFSLTLVMNSGVAFGLFSGISAASKAYFLLGLSGLISLMVLFYYFFERRMNFWSRFALAMVLGGAIGNMIDRWRYQKVVDFLDFHLGAYHWPAFNVADSFITIGVLMLLLWAFKPERGQ